MNQFSRIFFLALGILGFSPVSHASLVAYYNYDNASNLGLDSSGNGNNLTNSGGVTAGAGEAGGGAVFNGTNGILTGTLANLPTGNTSYTIGSWFKATGNYTNGGIVGWGNYGNYDQVIALRLDGPNRLHQYWWNNDLNSGTVASYGGAWHYVAVTYDSSTGVNDLYYDGSLVASRTAFGLNVGSANFAIGRTCCSEFFQGTLDDTAIYNNALNASQVTALMNGSLDSHVPEPETLPLVAGGLLGLRALARRRMRR